jgi:hypothetical protein
MSLQDGEALDSGSELDDSGSEEGFPSRTDRVPERSPIDLPSRHGHQRCRRLGVGHLVQQELQLRLGQANEALHHIRVALGHKAALFRTSIRHNKSQSRATRAWDHVKAVEHTAALNRRIYNRARKQMSLLGAEQRVLDKYKVLTKDDMKISTVVAEPNARGHRDDTLSWFWSMDVEGDSTSDDWMSECKYLRRY